MSETYYIDGANFHTLEEFYDEIDRNVMKGTSWGRNLNAFYDIWSNPFGNFPPRFTLVWRNSELSRERLGYAETIRFYEKRIAPGYNPFSLELEQAKNHQGRTLFEWHVELIREYDHIELILE